MLQFWKKNDIREIEQQRKLRDGHEALRSAALATVDVADDLTECLRQDSRDEDAILLCTLDGTVTGCNTSSKTMFSADMTHRPISEIFCVGDSPFLDIWAALLSDGTTKTKLVGLSRTGLSFPIDVSIIRLNREPEPNKILVLIRNMEASAKLNERRELLRDVASSVEKALDRIRERVG